MKYVYADNVTSTQVRQEVIDAINECNKYYGNPSSVHTMGKESKNLIDDARTNIAKSIGAKQSEIIFVSSGTEANNLALQGFAIADNIKNKRKVHIITTAIEHMSVLNPIGRLYDMGCDVTILPVDGKGKINLEKLRNSIRINTVLISVMFANNEIGTMQPIKKIGEICKWYNICFHTDAVSAFGHCDIDVKKLNIDMASLSGHKIYAPKGVGVLYAGNNIKLSPLLYGSGQEFGLRSGTENISGIVGMGKAVELSTKIDSKLKDKLISGIIKLIPHVKFNGSKENSLNNIVNVSFKGVDGEKLVSSLSSNGVYASTGSPCLNNCLKPYHVLQAIGVSDIPVRFSFGIYNTEEDVNYILNVLPDMVKILRGEHFNYE